MSAKPSLKERLEFVQTGLPGVTCMWAENCPVHFKYFHETYTITAMTDGVGRYVVRGKTYEATPNRISTWEPGDTHRVTCIDPAGSRTALPVATQRAFLLDPAVVFRAAEELGVPNTRLHVRAHDAHAPEAFQAVSRLADSIQNGASTLEQETNLALLLRSMMEHVLGGLGSEERSARDILPVRRAVEYMIANHGAPITLADLVDVTGRDQFWLLRAFKREIGLTPHAFLTQVRLARARGLLARGVPGSLVAASTGFSDQSHMIRCFRQSIGITPSQYCPR